MLNFLWASPTLSPRKTSAFVVSVSLSSAVYCAGDIVQGTIELSCDDETDAAEAMQFEACLELRLHGHLRIDPRWVQLPAPVRKIWGQTAAVDSTSKVSVMPAFAEFSNPNTACIFTTPPASVAAGLALPKKRKMNAKSTATVSTSDPAATASATPEKVASPAPEPSRHSQQLQQQQQERKQRTWRRSFVVALPSAMLPTFRGLGARVFYMATITVRSPPGAPPLGIQDPSTGQAQSSSSSSSSSHAHLHLPFTVLASGRGNSEGTATNSSHSSSGSSSSSGTTVSGGVKSVDLSHVHLATLNKHSVPHPMEESEQLPSVSVEPLDLMGRFRLRDQAGSSSTSASSSRGSKSNNDDRSSSSSGSSSSSSDGFNAKAPTLFTIRHGAPKPSTCCVVSLPRCDVTPGASLQVTLDFGNSAHATTACAAEDGREESSGLARAAAEMNKCLQVAAALVVRESYSGSNSSGKDPALSTTRGASYDTIIDTAHCFTYHARSCSFLLHIPLDAPLSFNLAGLVSLSYQLSFEFTIAAELPSASHHNPPSSGASNPSGALTLPSMPGSSSGSGATGSGGGSGNGRVEVLTWATAIKVVPPHSNRAALHFPSPPLSTSATRSSATSGPAAAAPIGGDSVNSAAPNGYVVSDGRPIESAGGVGSGGLGLALAYVPAASNHSRALRFTAPAAAAASSNTDESSAGTQGAHEDLQGDAEITHQSARSRNIAILV